jgi:hypothetical protein
LNRFCEGVSKGVEELLLIEKSKGDYSNELLFLKLLFLMLNAMSIK